MAFVIDSGNVDRLDCAEAAGREEVFELEWVRYAGVRETYAAVEPVEESWSARVSVPVEYVVTLTLDGTPLLRARRDMEGEVGEYLDSCTAEDAESFGEDDFLALAQDETVDDPLNDILGGPLADRIRESGPVTLEQAAAMLEPTWDSVEVLA